MFEGGFVNFVFSLVFQFSVMVHNPIGRASTEVLSFPVFGTDFEVLDSSAHPIPSQVLPPLYNPVLQYY